MRTEFIAVCLTLFAALACAKERRTYYDAKVMARVAEKIAKHPWAKRHIEEAKVSCKWLVEMSDQELWDFVRCCAAIALRMVRCPSRKPYPSVNRLRFVVISE